MAMSLHAGRDLLLGILALRRKGADRPGSAPGGVSILDVVTRLIGRWARSWSSRVFSHASEQSRWKAWLPALQPGERGAGALADRGLSRDELRAAVA